MVSFTTTALLIIGITAVIVSAGGGENYHHNKKHHNKKKFDVVVYGQFSSNVTQLSNTTITFQNDDGSELIYINDKDQSEILIEETCVYLVIWTIQVGFVCSTGEISSWARLNGRDIANSNAVQTNTLGNTALFILHLVEHFDKGDKFQLKQSTVDINGQIGAIASQAKDESDIPSAELTLICISREKEPYGQLFSTKTQFIGTDNPAGSIVSLDDIHKQHKFYGLRLRSSSSSSNDNSIIEYEEAGLYYIQVSVQLSRQGDGNVSLWLRLNGQDLPDSNIIQNIAVGEAGVSFTITLLELNMINYNS
ncbi:unnamed protein product [Didymodactylos carnosus]|uniref:Uncharacterized protein n=1 Tax=Didymodactylos carnosus TaxID=1234261 RepID=A0A8S2LK77_9BILA|nr:unnamed protein product [Didymodactylos carnosus]CAF3907780.1 unnamed protein product [Didymodactylos carnosus]